MAPRIGRKKETFKQFLARVYGDAQDSEFFQLYEQSKEFNKLARGFRSAQLRQDFADEDEDPPEDDAGDQFQEQIDRGETVEAFTDELPTGIAQQVSDLDCTTAARAAMEVWLTVGLDTSQFGTKQQQGETVNAYKFSNDSELPRPIAITGDVQRGSTSGRIDRYLDKFPQFFEHLKRTPIPDIASFKSMSFDSRGPSPLLDDSRLSRYLKAGASSIPAPFEHMIVRKPTPGTPGNLRSDKLRVIDKLERNAEKAIIPVTVAATSR